MAVRFESPNSRRRNLSSGTNVDAFPPYDFTVQSDIQVLQERLRAAENLAQARGQENDQLQEQLRRVQESLSGAREQVNELQQNLSTHSVERIELHRVKRDLEIIKDENKKLKDDFEARLREREDEWKSLHRRLTEREKDLAKIVSEKSVVETRAQTLERDVKFLTDRLNHAQETQQQLQADLHRVESERDRELSSCRTLVSRCKSVEEEAEREKKRALDAVNEMQKTIRKMEEDFAEEKKKIAEDFRKSENQKIQDRLNLEISHAQVSALAPAAAEEMLRNRGETLTKLYTEVIDEREKTRTQQEEIDRLNMYLEKIVEEVEATAPELINARLEYNRVLSNCDVLNEKLVEMFNENSFLQETLAKQSGEVESLRKENQELARLADDLSAQVRSLLAKSGGAQTAASPSFSSPPRQARLSKASASGDDDAQAIITESLVSYSSIQELQERNQQLLRLVRRLADESDETIPVAEAMDKLRQAEEEVKRMSEARQRQEEMILAIVQQRDLYRSLLNQADGKTIQSQQQLALISGATTTTTATAISGIPQDEFELYKKETQTELNMLNKSLEEARSAVQELKTKLARVTAERDMESQRLEQFNSLFDGTKQELERLRQSNHDQLAQISQAQSLLEQRQRELGDMNVKVKGLEYEKVSLEGQNDALKSEVEYLKDRAIASDKQRDAQRQLAEQSQRTLEGLEVQLKSLKEECARLEKVARETEAEVKEARKDRDITLAKADQEKQNLVHQLELSSKESQRVKESLARAEAEVEAMRRSQTALSEQLERALSGGVARSPTSATGGVASSTSSSSTFGIAQEMKAENDRLKRDLEARIKDVEALRAVLAEKDQSLKLLGEARDQLDKEKKEIAQEAAEERSALKAELDKAHRDIAELRMSLESTQKELNEAKQKISDVAAMEKRVQQAESDVKRFQKEVALANENYSRELQLHAADMTALTELRKKVDRAKEEVDAANRDKALMSQQMSTLSEELRVFRETMQTKLQNREKEIDDQRREIILLVAQVQTLSYRTEAASSSSSTGADDELSKTKEMLEIARRTRDLSVMEKESLELETKRLESQLQQARSETARFKDAVNQLEQQMFASVDRQNLQRTQQELEFLRTSNMSKANDLEKTQQELDRIRAQMRQEHETALALRQSEAEAKSKLSALQRELASKSEEAKLLKDRLDGVLNRIGNAELLDKLKQEVAQVTSERDEARAMVQKLNAQLVQLRGQMDKQVQLVNSELAEVRKQLQTRVAEQEEKEKTLQSQLEEKTKAVTMKEAHLVSFRKRVQDLIQENTSLKTKLTECESQVDKVTREMKEVRTRSASIASVPVAISVEAEPTQAMEVESSSPAAAAAGMTTVGTEETPSVASAPAAPTPQSPAPEQPQQQQHAVSPGAALQQDEPSVSAKASPPAATKSSPPPSPKPSSQDQPQTKPHSPAATTAATGESPTAPAAAVGGAVEFNLDSLPTGTLRKVSQELKLVVSNKSREQLLETLRQMVNSNGDAQIRNIVERLGVPAKKDKAEQHAKQEQLLQEKMAAKDEQHAKQKQLLQEKLAAKAEQHAKQKQLLHERMMALNKQKQAVAAQQQSHPQQPVQQLQPETLAPPPAEPAIVVDAADDAARRAARLARFGQGPAVSPAAPIGGDAESEGAQATTRKRKAESFEEGTTVSKQLKDDIGKEEEDRTE